MPHKVREAPSDLILSVLSSQLCYYQMWWNSHEWNFIQPWYSRKWSIMKLPSLILRKESKLKDTRERKQAERYMGKKASWKIKGKESKLKDNRRGKKLISTVGISWMKKGKYVAVAAKFDDSGSSVNVEKEVRMLWNIWRIAFFLTWGVMSNLQHVNYTWSSRPVLMNGWRQLFVL